MPVSDYVLDIWLAMTMSTIRELLYDWYGANRWLFHLLNSQAVNPADSIMLGLSWLGDHWRFPWYLALWLGAAAWQRRRGGGDGRILVAAGQYAWGFALMLALGSALKIGLDMPRPLTVLGAGAVRVLGEEVSRYSLPSGHAAFAALTAATLWPLARARFVRAVLIAFVLGVGVSRVWLGRHFPADIAAGYLVGLCSAWVAGYSVRLLARERDIGLAFAVTLFVFGLDLATKASAAAYLPYRDTVALLPMLNFTHVLNTGAAFSFLHDAGGWQRPLLTVIGIVASVVLWRWLHHKAAARSERVALALILGGTLGNVFDRVVRGAVVDWIDVYWRDWHWPAFNVADAAISIGAVLLLLYTFSPRSISAPPRA